jgi:hypothetical protein
MKTQTDHLAEYHHLAAKLTDLGTDTDEMSVRLRNIWTNRLNEAAKALGLETT